MMMMVLLLLLLMMMMMTNHICTSWFKHVFHVHRGLTMPLDL
jgi:hypothetical protein